MCDFWLYEVNFYGHIISKKGILVDSSKMPTIVEWPKPMMITDIRSFLRLASYYRKFIKDFSLVVAPMTKLTRKGVKFVWVDRCEQRFQSLMKSLITSQVLTFLNGNEGFVICSDAPKLDLGCVLMHNGKVVSYASQ